MIFHSNFEYVKRNREYILKIFGSNFDIDSNIEIIADGIKIQFNIIPLNSKDFQIVIESRVNIHNIQIYDISSCHNLLFELNDLILIRNSYYNFQIILGKIKQILRIIPKALRILWKRHKFIIPINMIVPYLRVLFSRIKHQGNSPFLNPFDKNEYNQWLLHKRNKEIYVDYDFTYKPLISFILPVYNVDIEYLTQCISSILNQTYSKLELCIVDDASTNIEIKKLILKYNDMDNRIKYKFRENNGHISRTSNDALQLATGEFVILIDHDDTIELDACFEIVKLLNKKPDTDFIYTDEDKIGLDGIYENPHFKPDFSLDTLLSLNYISHLACIRRSIIDEIGGFRIGFEGSQDYDLYLRIIEKTSKIYHIPQVLYHWRMTKNSTAFTGSAKNYAYEAGFLALSDYLKRNNINGHVIRDYQVNYYRINYHVNKSPLISIIIPTKDNSQLLEQCINSIYEKSIYSNFEIIVINNRSEEKNTFDLLENLKDIYSNFNYYDYDDDFNFSKICNYGVNKSNGEYVLLLNNDIKIISENWLNQMVGYASNKHIGAVGAKLFYEDSSIQHCGIVLGIGGVASHVFLNADKLDMGLYGRLRVPYNYSAVTGACLLVKKEKYYEVNGFTDELGVAYNDVDFCLKLQKIGYVNVVLPFVELYHFESKSRGYDTTLVKYKRFLKETKYMYKNWRFEIENDPFYNRNFSLKGWFLFDK